MNNKLEFISTQDLLGLTVNYANKNEIKVERLNTNHIKPEGEVGYSVNTTELKVEKLDAGIIKKERLDSIYLNNKSNDSKYEIVRLKLF
jgi:hypothetical protein